MEFVFEVIFGFLAELVLTVIGESLVELGFRSLPKFTTQESTFSGRFFIGFLYAAGGVTLGGISLQIVPLLVFGGTAVSVAYIIIAPVLAGLGLCLVNWIIHYGIDDRTRFFQARKFIYGALFALMFTLTRTMFGWWVSR